MFACAMLMRLLAGYLSIICSASLLGSQQSLEERARGVLHEVLISDQTWVKVHAAEALIAAGDGGEIRKLFLRERNMGEVSVYRIGVWRVLANTAPTATERSECIARIERVVLDPLAPDRPQAIETLCKLRHSVSANVLAVLRTQSLRGVPLDSIMPLWALKLAGEQDALARLADGLVAVDVKTRQRAAYALRWLRPTDPIVLRTLTMAAETEPADSMAYPYVLSAALSLEADHTYISRWQSKLEAVLATGLATARFEACQTLMHRFTKANLPQLVPLLDDPEPDTRVAVAWTILHLLAPSSFL